MAVALDQQFKIQKKGIMEERFPILHASNAEHHYFVTYVPLPADVEDAAAVEQWVERMTFICEDLTWLLQQSHMKFWCEICFNKEFHCMLDSYLRYAPRPQRSISLNNSSSLSNCQQLEEQVSRLMFLCVLRMSTHKESSDSFFTPQGYGHVIYDNYIFDIPRLFDLCAIYAIDNKELLTKMIENIFKQQEGYTKDLSNAIKSIQEVIRTKIQSHHTTTGPKKLNTKSKMSSAENIIDLLYYILDLSCTINRFCTVYEQGRIIFFREDFHLTLIDLYETFLRVYERDQQLQATSDYTEIFEETKYETITLFNDLLASCCIDPLLTNENKSEYVESLINIFSFLITEKRFLAAYEDYFSLCHLIDIIHQTTGLLDNQQIQFYTDGVKQAVERHGTPSCKEKLKSASETSTAKKNPIKKSANANVQMIQDMFPHLDGNYIQLCLDHYNNNTEQLVNALFDNTVPAHLKSDPTTTAAATSVFSTTAESEKPQLSTDFSLLERRLNIYDNDEFDIFHRTTVDLTRIHRGKKTRDSAEDLDDKSHLEGMRERYARLGLVEEEVNDDYDDEYDDTYDGEAIDIRDQDDTNDNELFKNENRLHGKQPGRFRQTTDDDDDNDEENSENKVKARDQFVENPEVVRERREQQRAAWQQRHQPHRSHADEKHDVVGGARGRGQSTTVTHNRRWKDAHKASHGNHNRRDRAAQKSNRGLLS